MDFAIKCRNALVQSFPGLCWAKPCIHYKRFICFKCTTTNAGNLSAALSLDFVGNELISVCDPHIASVVCCGLLYL